MLKAELAAKAAAHVEAKKQKAAKKAIYDEAKPNTKTKSKSKGARKRTLPKPKPVLPKSKPLVKRGKYVGTGAEAVDRPSTRSTRKKVWLGSSALNFAHPFQQCESDFADGTEAQIFSCIWSLFFKDILRHAMA